MLSSTLILIILSFFVGLGTWLIFLWAIKKGEFDDIEGPKYRMFDDDPPPTADQGAHDEKTDV